MLSSNQDPIFIVGCPRSGTTFLQSLLSSHSRVLIPPEDDFILRLQNALHGYNEIELQPPEVAALLDDLYSSEHAFANWDLARGMLERNLSQAKSLTPIRFVEIVHEVYLDQFAGKTRWGCKVPYFALHIQQLATIFPRAKFIHLVRDGRDTYLSMKDRNRGGATHFPTNAMRAARIWRKIVLAASAAGKKLEGRYCEIRYEKLVTDVQPTLRSICEYVDEPFNPGMITGYFENLQQHQHRRQSDLNKYVKRQVDATNVERWRNEMTPEEIYEYQKIAGETLRRYGYPLVADQTGIRFVTKVRCWMRQLAYVAWDSRPTKRC